MTTHAHNYILGPPDLNVVVGQCDCGATKEYPTAPSMNGHDRPQRPEPRPKPEQTPEPDPVVVPYLDVPQQDRAAWLRQHQAELEADLFGKMLNLEVYQKWGIPQGSVAVVRRRVARMREGLPPYKDPHAGFARHPVGPKPKPDRSLLATLEATLETKQTEAKRLKQDIEAIQRVLEILSGTSREQKA